jgi:transposase
MHIVHPTPEQVDELHSMRFHHPCPAVQRRAEIILLAAHFIAYGKIAVILGICPNTVTNTLVAFESSGTGGLTLWRAGGTDGELAAFDSLMHEYWSEHPPRTVKEAATQLEEVTGVKRRTTTVRDFMKRLGLKRRKAGSVPGKADPEKQRRFVREVIEPCVSAARGGENVMYFMDASHFVFGAFLGYVWCLARVFIPTAPGRQRYNVLGAVDIIGGTLLTVSNTTYVNAATVCEMLAKMAAANFGKRITVFLDNARYQRCSLVMDKARELGIELSFLPSYSPNLNLIERFWKYVKKTCLTNHAFTDFRQFRAAIDNCIEEAFKMHAEDLRTLLAPNFQIIEFSQSQTA